MRAAVYARVSTNDQTAENQLLELRQYCAARGWEIGREYVDTGVSGAKATRPALDDLVREARRRRFDTVVIWDLSRLGRSLKNLILLLEELHSIGISVVSLREGLDLGSSAGRLQMQILAALAEWERSRLSERTRSGLARARAQGARLGRPRVRGADLDLPAGLTVRRAAELWGVSPSTAGRRLAAGQIPNVDQTLTDQ